MKEASPTPIPSVGTSLGPGAVVFSNETTAATTATFSAAGSYQLELVSTNAFGETSRTLAVSVAANPAFQSDWLSSTWPGVSDPAITGPHADPDHDGLENLLEWALGLDATRPDRFQPDMIQDGDSLSSSISAARPRRVRPHSASNGRTHSPMTGAKPE